ncbi:MAG: sigma-70 family RNA polymerase sigma factor [Planctomycetota bacterium]
MFPDSVDLAFARFQKRADARALALVFDRTALELLGLARHLAVTPSDAEDLVQATFVTAIEDAGSHRPGQRVLPWLLGILNNHARASRRQARRQLDPDRIRHAAADADVEAFELRDELRAAIDGLPEVYRPVLRLVFEHGLQANEIATALERPAGTVRAQLARGLDLLRRTLPASLAGSAALAVGTGRGLAAVRDAVLSRCGGTNTGFFSALSLGRLLMLQPKILAALGAAVLLALGFVWFDRAPSTPALAKSTQGGPATASTKLETTAPNLTNERLAVTPELPATTVEPTTTLTKPAETKATLVVRLRDPAGTPVQGMGVAVYPFRDVPNFSRNTYVSSDAVGEVRFTGLEALQWAIDLDRLGMVGAVDAVLGETIVREVDVPAGIRVEGTVVDGRGSPVAAASVVLHGSRAGTPKLAMSDALGHFAIDFMAPGVELQARAAGRQPSLAHTVRGSAGTKSPMELVLGDAARTVQGRVLDAAGQPVATATVAILPDAAAEHVPYDPATPQVRAHWQSSDADGRFTCDEVGIGKQVVFVKPSETSLAPSWLATDTTSGDSFVEVLVPPAASVRGTASRDDAPAAGLQVLAWPTVEPRLGYLLNLFGMRTATTAADGTFHLQGLWAGEQRLRLLDGMTTLTEQTLTLRESEQATWNCNLTAAAKLRIEVLCSEPLAKHRLVAMVSNTEIRNGDAPAVVPIQANGIAEHTATRNQAVDVVITCMPGGRSMLQLAAVRGILASQDSVKITLQPQQLPTRSIAGRLVDAQQAPLAGRTTVAQRRDNSGLMVRCEATTAADGSFAIGPLPAGDYTLLEGPLQSPRVVARCTVTAERDELVGDLVVTVSK